MKYMEYKEVSAPDEVLNYLEKKALISQNVTFAEAGYFDFLSELSKEGWRPIWQTWVFPTLVMEREVEKEIEN